MKVSEGTTTSDIYALIDPETKEVRYVGQTTIGISNRLKQHVFNAKRGIGNSEKNDWIISLLSRDKHPKVKLLETCDINESHHLEDEWIKNFIDLGMNLFNAEYLLGTGSVHFHKGSKKNFTYTIEEAIEQELDRIASKIYRSKSSIVQEAIQNWLKQNKKS